MNQSSRFSSVAVSLAWVGLCLVASATHGTAADATWKLDPVSSNWAFDQNWTPESRPYTGETATLDISNVTNIVTSGIIGKVVFTPTASAYTLRILPMADFGVGGVGLLNSSGRLQKFDLQTSSTARSLITFYGGATAGALTDFRIRGAVVANRPGAVIYFEGAATAGSGNFVTEGGSAVTALGASIEFRDDANAGQGTFTTRGGEVSQGNGGTVYFYQNSSAAEATFYNLSGSSSLAGKIFFWDSSSAGSSHIFNRYGPTNEETPGATSFNFTASAGTSTIVNDGGRPGSGFTQSATTAFAGNSTAALASITNRAALQSLGLAGRTYFSMNAHAGSATIVNEGAALANTQGGFLSFSGSSTDTVNAESAMIVNQGASAAGGGAGGTFFNGTTAAQATITNESGSNGGVGGTTEFAFVSRAPSAGSATIINKAPTSSVLGGVTTFRGGTAGTANITAEGSAVAGDSAVIFPGTEASQSTITLFGATTAAGMGGRLQFENSGTAGQATLRAKAGTVPNAPGGRILFFGQAQGGTARAHLEAGARLDLSSLTNAGMDIGAIEGVGDVFLGAKNLRIGSDNGDALFAGVLRDGGLVSAAGGSVTKIGAGTLTLSGANLYTGATTVSTGTLCLSGSIVGNVSVNAGATLCLAGGSVGQSGSTVTVAAKGHIAGFGAILGNLTNNGLVETDGFGTLILSGAVTNNGVIRIRGGGVLDASDAPSFTNNGTLDVITGFANLPPNFSNGPGGIVLDSSVVRVKEIARTGTQVTITIDGYTGHSYQLQSSDRPAPGSSFQNLGAPQTGNTGTVLSFQIQESNPAGFYRVAVDL